MQYNKNNYASDLNVVSAWIQGYTGKGVVVSIVDDGMPHLSCLAI